MGIFKVTSVVRDRRGKLTNFRTEYIDTSKNVLFRGINSKQRVGQMHESFWNLDPTSDKKVKTLKVDRANVLSKGANWGIKVWKLKQVI